MAEHQLQSVAFPELSEAHIAALAECTEARTRICRDGDVLIEVGARAPEFFVVLRGAVDIVDTSGASPRTIVTHHKGNFTGDVTHLTGNPAVIRAVARGDTQVHAITSAAVKRMINLCPEIGDIVLQAFIARRQLLRESADFVGLRVIGSRYSKDSFRVREFLAKNHVMFTWLDIESDPDVRALLEAFQVTEADTPIVACSEMLVRRNPSNRDLAEAIGILQPLERELFDLAIVGSGPAGLAAAVYGASEGLNTVVFEHTAPGGQAGSSMRIENYLGFPTGVTGDELTDRAVIQANKFGARLSVPARVTGLGFKEKFPMLMLDEGEPVIAKTLLIATGADYRRLPVDGCAQFEGCGVYYAATFNEARTCSGTDVIVVGGGNSAGQAAVFLASHARRVILVVRGKSLYDNMSSYLAKRIEDTDQVEIHLNSSISQMRGNGFLSEADVRHAQTGEQFTVETQGIFSFIGASPRTDWLPDEIEKDENGFVLTGPSIRAQHDGRAPFHLETSRRGVFAAGDVRAGSVKRVASAVGEGSMAIQFVHEYMKEL